MDIEGLGDKMVALLLEHNVIRELPAMYELTVEQLQELPRMGELSSKNLVAAIHASKRRPLDRFIFALGIRHVGSKTGLVLARHCGTIERFLEVTEEELLGIDEIGPETAASITSFLKDDGEVAIVRQLLKHGVHPEPIEVDRAKAQKLAGATFVLTGTFSTMSRKQAEAKILEWGGKVSGSVSKKTHYVVAGESPGSKLDTAEKLGVPVISEDDLIAMLQGA
jgi:DNA ligase (NAD+)